MDVSVGAVYLVSVLLLFGKYLAVIALQARERLRLLHFRYPEDAAHWKGRLAEDSDLCQRCQRLLLNDSETQPFYFVLGAAYVVLGVWPGGAILYLWGYALSRLCHAYFMLRARQPHRNRAFAVGVLMLTIMAIHLLYAALTRLVR